MPSPVQYSTRFDSLELLQRGRTTTLQCRVYRAGALVTPTASGSTFSLLDEDGEPIVDDVPVTVSQGVASYSVAAATTEDLALGEDYLARWILVMPDGTTHTFEARVALCRCVPAVPITEAALFARAPALDPRGPGAISARRDYASTIDDCWSQLRELLLERGQRAELVVTSAELREPLLLLCLAHVFEGLAPLAADSTYADRAAEYRSRFAAVWSQTTFRYDPDDDGVPETTTRPARGPTWAM